MLPLIQVDVHERGSGIIKMRFAADSISTSDDGLFLRSAESTARSSRTCETRYILHLPLKPELSILIRYTAEPKSPPSAQHFVFQEQLRGHRAASAAKVVGFGWSSGLPPPPPGSLCTCAPRGARNHHLSGAHHVYSAVRDGDDDVADSRG